MTFTLPTTGSGPVMSTKQWLEGAINAAIEAAVSAAALGFVLYGSVSAGLAATQDGEGFSVFTATGLQLYANSAGVADLQGEIPLASTTTALAARITALEDQAFAESPIYETTAEGIAATGEGDRFRVENPDAAIAYDIYDHDTGGVATFVTDIPAGSALATKLTTSNALSELVGVATAARANIGAASARDVTQLKARSLHRDGFAGWADPVFDRESRIGGGWKRDGTFHAKGFGVGVLISTQN
ncbi:hypothetical protein [Sulfitobacter sp. 1A09132]|uniref:hypothetical protein n=1 Tax=Sulfitobacter sp. 1A09132 TaxID=3368582 RepID=UPI003745207B